MYDKKAIYDEQIAPLMDQIANICQENDIQMLANFALKEAVDDEGPLLCMTCVPSSEYEDEKGVFIGAFNVFMNDYKAKPPFSIAMFTRDKE